MKNFLIRFTILILITLFLCRAFNIPPFNIPSATHYPIWIWQAVKDNRAMCPNE